MRKPIFTRITRLSSRTNLVRCLQWNLQKRFLAEIGPLQFQLDQLSDIVETIKKSTLAGMKVSRDFQKKYNQENRSIQKELRKITIGYGIAIVILSLGCLIGFLVN